MSETPEPNVNYVEIYATHQITALQILADVLDAADIPILTRKIDVSGFGLSTGASGEHRLAVPQSRVEVAQGLVRQAIVDGAVRADEGELM